MIGASAKVGSAFPTNNNTTKIPLICFGIACTFTSTIPEPFYVTTAYEYNSNGYQIGLLNTFDIYEYGLDPYEELWNFISIDCINCTQVDMKGSMIAKDYHSPFTKQSSITTTRSGWKNDIISTSTILLLLISCFM